MKRTTAPLAWLPAVVCAACGLAIFQFWGNATRGYIATDSLFYWWGFQWVNPQSETEHGWLVLALSVFVLFRNLRRPSASGPRAGGALAAMLLGMALHAVGFVAQQARVSILALLLFTWGVAALAGGRKWADASVFPLGFMVFSIPVNVLDGIGFWLRMWVVEAGEGFSHLVGIGVIRSGTQLIAPDGRYHYDVAAACSGVRSLMALAALSLLVGYLWLKPFWLRAGMLVLSLPLVYLGNLLRICSIVVAASWGGQTWGDRTHDVMGFGVFVVVLGGVLAAADFVAMRRPEWAAGDRPADEPPTAADGAVRFQAAASVIILLLAVLESAFLAHRAALVPVGRSGVLLAAGGGNPVELPSFLGSDWMGRSIEPGAVERSILPPDTGYSRKLYMSRGGAPAQVLLSIVLSGRDRSSIHRPELCLVGQGWTIERSWTCRFAYPGREAAGIEATLLRVQREPARAGDPRPPPEIVAYWFVGSDRSVASPLRRVLVDAWNRVARGRADRWAYVLLQTTAADGEEAAVARIQSILTQALPVFEPPIIASP